MQNEARFEFVLIEGEGGTPNAPGTQERSGGLEETNRLLQKILEAQGFRKLGSDGAEQQPKKPVSAEDLASLPIEPTRAPDLIGPSISNDSRSVILPPSPRITLPEATKPPEPPTTPERPAPTLPQVETPAIERPEPPTPSTSTTEPGTPPTPATVKPDTSLEDMHQKFRDETKQITDKLMDDLFGERRRRRDAEKGIIQAELAPAPKPPEPVAPLEREAVKPPGPSISPDDDGPALPATPAPPPEEDPLERSKREWDDLQNNFARDWANERRQRANEARERMGLPIKPIPGATPAIPAELPSVPPPATVTIPKSIPAIGGMAVSGAAVAGAAGVTAGVVGVAAIAKANYELIQSVDTLAKQLAPKLVNYSPEVAAAQAAADLREVMRAFSTSDRLGESVGRLVEANSVIKDAMAQLRDVISGPIMADAASMKEGLAGILSVVGNFAEKNQAVYDALYNVATRYIPGPQQMIGELAKLGEIAKALTGYESKTGSFDQIFMDNGMITPPGWSNTPETDISTSFAEPGVELP